MKQIPLTKNQFALVDDEDFDFLNQWKWYYTSHGYAAKDKLYMHRLIMNSPKNKFIDHADTNRLNNQRENLRLCDNRQNHMNGKKHRDNKSGFKGVVFIKDNYYTARIKANGKIVYLGIYTSPIPAAMAYDAVAIKMFGKYARCNFPET